MQVSNLAYVHPDAKIGKGTVIEPFTTIHADVVIGENCVIGPNAVVFDGARIGNNVKIFPGASISAIPQDLKYQGEKTITEIGDNTIIRECVTLNKGTSAAGKTVIGSNCLLMAYVHVAHDCILGNNIILANSVNLAGHIEIEDHAILEGLVAVQQFVRIGAHSFIAGASLVRKNVPPFIKAAREPLSFAGVNSVGLRRRGYSIEQVNQIQDIYRVLFQQGYSVSRALEIIENDQHISAERETIMSFVKNSPKGIIKGYTGIDE